MFFIIVSTSKMVDSIGRKCHFNLLLPFHPNVLVEFRKRNICMLKHVVFGILPRNFAHNLCLEGGFKFVTI